MATTPRQPRASRTVVNKAAAHSISATTVAQSVRLESCERYLWHRLHDAETRALFRNYGLTEQPLTPLLTKKGAVHEEAVVEELAASADVIDLADAGADETVSALAESLERPRALVQATVERELGSFKAGGVADLVLLEPVAEGALRVSGSSGSPPGTGWMRASPPAASSTQSHRRRHRADRYRRPPRPSSAWRASCARRRAAPSMPVARRWFHTAPPGLDSMGSRSERGRPSCLTSRGSPGVGGW